MLQKDSFIIMYHGGIIPERGIEALIEVISINQNLLLYVLGNGKTDYVQNLKELCRVKKVEKRVIFHKAVPQEDLWKYIGAADLGMIMVRAAWKSYYYMLPNKFFECIQAETPVLTSNFPAIKPMVDKYEIGYTCDPDDIMEINAKIEKIRLNPEIYNKFKRNLLLAKEELCWEKEKQILKEAYRRIL